MSAAFRLVRIEIRRSIGLWLFLPFMAIALWVAWEELDSRVWLWTETSYALLYSVVLLVPLAGAIGAWAAIRDHRRQTHDLLDSTPYSNRSRMFANWAGTTAWTVASLAAASLALGVITAWNSNWGSPLILPILVGVVALTASSAIGFAVGSLIPRYITPPILGVSLYLAQALAVYNPSAVQYLSPLPEYSAVDVFHSPRWEIHLAELAWLAGLTGVALTVSLLRRYWNSRHLGLLICSLIIGTGGVAFLIRADGREITGDTVSYTPVCVDAQIPVCVHPAYEPMLEDTADVVGRITAPIAGIEGVPARAEQRSGYEVANTAPEDVLIFELRSVASDVEFAAVGYFQFADTLTRRILNIDAPWLPPDSKPQERQIKEVMANWLLGQAGIPRSVSIDEFSGRGFGFQLNPDQEAALDRFVELDGDRQRDWLEEHFAALRAGELTLEDLP